uniref:ubiquitin carboxyl-terminal hydrolase isozyme L5-like n=1 Tax=Styela clava TaxID=7725 RepID=UPI00193A4094|nr:ubiquitin carboxyl-terminal hydrolase isozyme L5-like [Styela clava]
MAGEWCLIESDPGVFSALIRDFGVEGVQVEEIFSLDDDSFESLKPVHGLVFLFKCIKDSDPKESIVQDSRLDDIFFAKQVITNACATQAIVNILLNVKHGDVRLGSMLSDFRDFTQAFDSVNKGLALSNSILIRTVHNSFSRQQIFEYDNSMPRKEEDSYHFIGYVPIDGRLYELDGIKAGPIDHGSFGDTDWLNLARTAIQKRINRYKEGEIHFNLMAITSDRKMVLEKQIKDLQAAVKSGEEMETENRDQFISTEINRLQNLIDLEDEKRRNYKVENVRRKHNYLPFIVEMIKILASERKLLPLVQDAKEKLKEKGKKSSF